MDRRKPIPSRTLGSEFVRTQATLAMLALAAAVPIALAMSLVPRPLVLPLLCLAASAGAGAVANVAWWRGARRRGDRITIWDLAGALALIGCAAGILGKPDSVLELFERVPMTN
jgi:hypothetical protein